MKSSCTVIRTISREEAPEEVWDPGVQSLKEKFPQVLLEINGWVPFSFVKDVLSHFIFRDSKSGQFSGIPSPMGPYKTPLNVQVKSKLNIFSFF